MNKPQFMIDNPNWMNTPELPETVYVHMAGEVQPTRNGIHLERFLREGGQIVPDPDAPVTAPEAVHAPAPVAPALAGVPDVVIVNPEKPADLPPPQSPFIGG